MTHHHRITPSLRDYFSRLGAKGGQRSTAAQQAARKANAAKGAAARRKK